MIKNTIIVILLILLIITFYSYYCISTNVVNFQKERMEFVLAKESEIKDKERKLVDTVTCNKELIKHKTLYNNLISDLHKLSTHVQSVTQKAENTSNERVYMNDITNITENNYIDDTVVNANIIPLIRSHNAVETNQETHDESKPVILNTAEAEDAADVKEHFKSGFITALDK
ncbi:MAG: hypothetical protein Gaeavirus41_1 [Gaeavirus sp.]|uniref:Uncharacterized protein n=1 Tax=Gaeavirus sp. TaxID=2487767 RepID=A0A3G4ZZM0_9VIRU|nr:MAG: hypothetical protein Gaeavirus41_1 [Gaeavirus sp.]